MVSSGVKTKSDVFSGAPKARNPVESPVGGRQSEKAPPCSVDVCPTRDSGRRPRPSTPSYLPKKGPSWW